MSHIQWTKKIVSTQVRGADQYVTVADLVKESESRIKFGDKLRDSDIPLLNAIEKAQFPQSHDLNPIMVLGQPGSGKTSVITTLPAFTSGTIVEHSLTHGQFQESAALVGEDQKVVPQLKMVAWSRSGIPARVILVINTRVLSDRSSRGQALLHSFSHLADCINWTHLSDTDRRSTLQNIRIVFTHTQKPRSKELFTIEEIRTKLAEFKGITSPSKQLISAVLESKTNILSVYKPGDTSSIEFDSESAPLLRFTYKVSQEWTETRIRGLQATLSNLRGQLTPSLADSQLESKSPLEESTFERSRSQILEYETATETLELPVRSVSKTWLEAIGQFVLGCGLIWRSSNREIDFGVPFTSAALQIQPVKKDPLGHSLMEQHLPAQKHQYRDTVIYCRPTWFNCTVKPIATVLKKHHPDFQDEYSRLVRQAKEPIYSDHRVEFVSSHAVSEQTQQKMDLIDRILKRLEI